MAERGSSPSHASRREAAARRPLGPIIVGVALTVLAAQLIYQALQISTGAGFSVVGPGTIPLAVASVLFVLAVVFLARTTVWPDADLGARAVEEERATHWATVGIILGVLVIYALALNGVRFGSFVIPGLGYIPATGFFLPVVARVLGSDHLVRDLVIGFALAVVVYFGFTQFLGVRLPAGLLGLVL